MGTEVPDGRPALGNAWAEFVPFIGFDRETRRILCTTTAIESVNARTRSAVRARGHLPNEQAALKCVYLAGIALDPSGTVPARRTQRWKRALNAFDVRFVGRLSASRGRTIPNTDPRHTVCLTDPVGGSS